MRVLLDKDSRIYLFNYLKNKTNCYNLSNLSKLMSIPSSTLGEWRYNPKRYLPEKFIPVEITSHLKIIDKQEDSWGKKKGGKKTYKILIKKYGLKEISKRQSNGGKKSKRDYNEFILPDIKNSLFLEFYGVLLGDGWISKLKYKNKITYLIGISGHYSLDRDFFLYLKNNILNLFNRRAYLKDRPKYNSIELNFAHKSFLNYLNTELGFPIGKK
ncbi:hypothetical protein J4218_00860 [Candidatus Pacearchaeota archaeon]|nr:hypothetical protein [Candidatus Pacearchaeota archaeon]